MRTAVVAGLLGLLSFSVSCGARTGLPGLGADDGAGGAGGSTGVFVTSGPQVTGSSVGGGGNDGGGGDGEGGEGGAPPFPECDPDVLFIYLVTSQTDLYRFDPSLGQDGFVRVGGLQCPSGGSPFSMAVSRSGRAYSVYNTGELFRINVKNAACSATGWEPRLAGDFERFGMGYAIDDDGLGESLYVADITFEFPSAGLGTIDPADDYAFRYVGPFSENPGNAIELTSSDDGELYGYFLTPDGGTVVRIDKTSGVILDAVDLPVGGSGSLAFAYWNGDFYIFTGNGAGSTVTRYRPADGSLAEIATLPLEIVGAGVTTCDPDDAG